LKYESLSILLSVGLLLGGSACSNQGSTIKVTKPRIDSSTPESALESFWRVSDWRSAYSNEVFSKDRYSEENKEIQELEAKVVGDKIRGAKEAAMNVQKSSPKPVFKRTIIEMKKETDTRVIAFVQIYNITPIPPGIDNDPILLKWREEGTKAKYVLIHNTAGWVVDEIYSFEKYKNDWEPLFEKPKVRIPWHASPY
jgi:hypothetical protein